MLQMLLDNSFPNPATVQYYKKEILTKTGRKHNGEQGDIRQNWMIWGEPSPTNHARNSWRATQRFLKTKEMVQRESFTVGY